MKTKNRIVIIVLEIFITIVACLLVKDYLKYHPIKILEGTYNYRIGYYKLEKKGLLGLKPMIKKTIDMPKNYCVAEFDSEVNENGKIISFNLSLDVFDSNNKYIGESRYEFSKYKLTYSPPEKATEMLTIKNNPNSSIDYLDLQLKKIPLKKQIKEIGKDFERYYIHYQPYSQIDKGTPIFDGRSEKEFPVLTKDEYNSGKGGRSDGKTNVVFTIYNGESIAVGQLYNYVFKPIDEETAVGNQDYNMQCDYYINNYSLRITRDYGQSWIDTDITKEQLKSTMDFYRNHLSIPLQSIFISPDKKLPIAYFYGSNAKLKILHNNSDKWINVSFPTNKFYDLPTAFRAVGFTSPNFGYAALGTDYTMGCGESKMCYFTWDGGETWQEKTLPKKGTRLSLIDMCMANEKEGIVALHNYQDNGEYICFPQIYATADTANKWFEIELPYSELPKDVLILSDIESFTYKDNKYTLVLGQGKEGIKKAVFTSTNLKKGWKFSKVYESAIHTVG